MQRTKIKEMQKREKICGECCKKINLSTDHFVLIGTYNRVISPDDEQYFHFGCWVDYFNHCVDKKMRANISYMQDKAMQIFNTPEMKRLLGQIHGTETLMSLLSYPIRIDDKKDDGRMKILKKTLKKLKKNSKVQKKARNDKRHNKQKM